MSGALVRRSCNHEGSEEGTRAVSFGSYFRKSDQVRIQRFQCTRCKSTFSTASFDSCFAQHKRGFNKPVATLLVSGVSQRRLAKILRLNRKTVVRKLIFLGLLAKLELTRSNLALSQARIVEFDDLETIEHTKLKPLSVTLAVEHKSRRILGFRVSRMPAKGLLSALSVKRYGRRKDQRPRARAELFRALKDLVHKSATFKSDENPHYPRDVRRFFPNARHQTHKGRKGAVVGQGELKKILFDPLFSLNHTCAMLRANINRLFRKTWCTTKRPDRLDLHIALYAVFHNASLKT